MHEISLIRSMFGVIAETHPEIPLERISRIHLQVGEISNAEPLALQSAFEALAEVEPEYAHIELQITQTPILIYCESCRKNVPVQHYRFVCDCGTPSTRIVQGDELLVREIEYEAE